MAWLIIGRVVAIIFVALLLINGFVMLVSPVRWFAMPSWLRTQGTLTPERHSRGFGAIELRILGALIILSISWVAYSLFLQPGPHFRLESSFPWLTFTRIIEIIVIALMLVNGSVMLISPSRWFSMQWWFKLGTLTAERYSRGFDAVHARILGGIVVLSTLWMAYELFLAQARLS